MKFSISLPTGFEGVMYPIPFVDPSDFVRMAKLCDGNVLPHGLRGHYYLLRENGAVSHEVWDVTNPADPTLVSTPSGSP